MKMPVAARLRTRFHRFSSNAVRWYYNTIWGTDIGEGSRISLKARIDLTNPRGIHIGKYTMVTFDVAILSHDFVNNKHRDVHIGSCCFIGCGAVIMPGVTIGDHCIIGANAVVTKDIPPHSIAVGNPAQVIESNIATTKYGIRARAAA